MHLLERCDLKIRQSGSQSRRNAVPFRYAGLAGIKELERITGAPARLGGHLGVNGTFSEGKWLAKKPAATDRKDCITRRRIDVMPPCPAAGFDTRFSRN